MARVYIMVVVVVETTDDGNLCFRQHHDLGEAEREREREREREIMLPRLLSLVVPFPFL